MYLTDTYFSFQTSLTCEAWLAHTLVIIGQLYAVQAVGGVAGIGKALVDVSFTAFSSEAWRAVTSVPSNPVHTCAVILTLGYPSGP